MKLVFDPAGQLAGNFYFRNPLTPAVSYDIIKSWKQPPGTAGRRKMTKQEHIEANAKYISDDSLAALAQAPESAWATIQSAADALDASDIGTDCEVAATRETLEDFDNSRTTAWAERGKRIAGEGFVVYENIQIAKGDRRQSIAVIDCGDIRIALTA